METVLYWKGVSIQLGLDNVDGNVWIKNEHTTLRVLLSRLGPLKNKMPCAKTFQ